MRMAVDMTRLPKWAQKEFAVLQMRLSESERGRATAEVRKTIAELREALDAS